MYGCDNRTKDPLQLISVTPPPFFAGMYWKNNKTVQTRLFARLPAKFRSNTAKGLGNNGENNPGRSKYLN